MHTIPTTHRKTFLVKFVGVTPDEFKTEGSKSPLPYKPVWIDLLSGNPNSLGFGFSIWGGSGMDDVEDHAIVFSKESDDVGEPRSKSKVNPANP